METDYVALHDQAGQLVWVDTSAPVDDGIDEQVREWWQATHVAHLPPGTNWLGLITSGQGMVTVGLCEEVPPVESGLNDPKVLPHDPETRLPSAHRTIPVYRVLAPVRGFIFDEVEEGEFFRVRDAYRVEQGLPRAVVRSDHYNTRPTYMLRHPWPAGTFVQGGIKHERVPATPEQEADPDVRVRDGHVLAQAGVFLEAFPREPSTFLRTEAVTFEEAEARAWAKFTQYTGCPSPTGGHEFEARGYRNGAGFCRHCGMFGSKVIDLASIGSLCVVCGTPSYWALIAQRHPDGAVNRDVPEDIVCENHVPGMGMMEVGDALHDFEHSDGPMPDISWFEEFLPAGVPVTQVGLRALGEAVDRGRRALLDEMIAQAKKTSP